MKALVKAFAKPGIWMHDVPKPTKVGPNEVMIKIRKTAICGTDMHIYHWDKWAQDTVPVPMITGHEFVGEIVELGSEVTGLKVGDRVSGEGHLTCSNCRNCRAGKRFLCRNVEGIGYDVPGCFAEYFVFPSFNVIKIPDDIPDNIAAFMDPFGNATHTALSFDCVGEDVLITGAGPIGIMAVAICKHVGARHVVITDINDYRLNLAKTMGATRAVNVKKQKLTDVIQELKMEEGFDIGLEMSGNGPAFREMLDLMCYGGRVAILGIPSEEVAINWGRMVFKGLFLKGVYGREMFETWYKMIAMLQSGLDISPVLTHEFKIDDFQKAFEVMDSGNSGKVILDWT